MLLWKKIQELTVTKTLRRPNRKLFIPVSGNASAGATAGWLPAGGTGATNIPECRLPQSVSGGTLNVNLTGWVQPGDRIKSYYFVGQVESAGGNVSMTTQLKYNTAAAADNVSTSIGSGSTTGTLTADTLLTPALAGEAFTGGVLVLDDTTYSILVTGTTAASTDIALLGLVLVVDQA